MATRPVTSAPPEAVLSAAPAQSGPARPGAIAPDNVGNPVLIVPPHRPVATEWRSSHYPAVWAGSQGGNALRLRLVLTPVTGSLGVGRAKAEMGWSGGKRRRETGTRAGRGRRRGTGHAACGPRRRRRPHEPARHPRETAARTDPRHRRQPSERTDTAVARRPRPRTHAVGRRQRNGPPSPRRPNRHRHREAATPADPRPSTKAARTRDRRRVGRVSGTYDVPRGVGGRSAPRCTGPPSVRKSIDPFAGGRGRITVYGRAPYPQWADGPQCIGTPLAAR